MFDNGTLRCIGSLIYLSIFFYCFILFWFSVMYLIYAVSYKTFSFVALTGKRKTVYRIILAILFYISKHPRSNRHGNKKLNPLNSNTKTPHVSIHKVNLKKCSSSMPSWVYPHFSASYLERVNHHSYFLLQYIWKL